MSNPSILRCSQADKDIRTTKLSPLSFTFFSRFLRSSQNTLSDTLIEISGKTPVFELPLKVDRWARSNEKHGYFVQKLHLV